MCLSVVSLFFLFAVVAHFLQVHGQHAKIQASSSGTPEVRPIDLSTARIALGGAIGAGACEDFTLPKPNLYDCAHVFHMRAPKATTVTRIASQDARSV